MSQEIQPKISYTDELKSTKFSDSLEKLLQLFTPELVPSGILLIPMSWGGGHIERNDGTAPESITQAQWNQMYFDLCKFALPYQPNKALSEIKERVKEVQSEESEEQVPISIINLRYHRPTRSFEQQVRVYCRKDEPVPVPEPLEKVIEERRTFFAGALIKDRYHVFTKLPYTYRGSHVRFYLDPELYISNTGETPQSIEVDLDDGNGFRSTALGETLEANYERASVKNIKLRASYAQETLSASFLFTLESASKAPKYDQKWSLQGSIVLGDKTYTARGKAYVYFGYENFTNKHTSIQQPLIIADGFPGHDYDWLYDKMSQLGTMRALLLWGYDVIFVTYKDGEEEIQKSAAVVMACIQEAISLNSSCQLVVGGGSMGGLTARFALAYMEQEQIPHHTRLFFTFDTPHRGACLPMALQWAAGFFKDASSKAADKWELIGSGAGRQLLIYNYPKWMSGDTQPLFDEQFWTQLFALNNHTGYPQQPTKIAIADGSGGGGLVLQPTATLVEGNAGDDIDPDKYLDIATYADPYYNTGETVIGQGYYYEPGSTPHHGEMQVENLIPYSDSPGGIGDYIGALYDALLDATEIAPVRDIDLESEYHCLVPTFSAIDYAISSSAIFNPLPSSPSTPFAQLYFNPEPGSSKDHLAITPQIKEFIFQNLGGIGYVAWYDSEVTVPGLTSGYAAIRFWEDSLYIAYRGYHEQNDSSEYYLYLNSYNFQTESWSSSNPSPFYDVLTSHSPALAFFTDKQSGSTIPFIAYVGGSGTVYALNTQSYTQSGTKLSGSNTSSVPAIAECGGTLYIAYLTSSGNLALWSSTDGHNWTQLQNLPSSMTTTQGPALAVKDGKLYLFYAASDGGVTEVYIPDDYNGSNAVVVDTMANYQSTFNPAVALFDDMFYMACVAKDTEIVYSWASTLQWIGGQFPVGNEVKAGVSLAANATSLYLVYSGSDGVMQLMTGEPQGIQAQLKGDAARRGK
jgi:hypothetical protein